MILIADRRNKGIIALGIRRVKGAGHAERLALPAQASLPKRCQLNFTVSKKQRR